MSRKIVFSNEEATLKLTGLTPLLAFKRNVQIPYRFIKSARVEDADFHPLLLRFPGTTIPFTSIYEGSFLHQKEWTFIACSTEHSLVVLELLGHPDFHRIIFEDQDPARTVEKIRSHLKR